MASQCGGRCGRTWHGGGGAASTQSALRYHNVTTARRAGRHDANSLVVVHEISSSTNKNTGYERLFSFSHLRVVKCFALPHPLQVASQELISDESKADTKTQTESGSSFFDSINVFLGVYYYFCKLSQPSSLISLCQFLKVWWCRE